MIVTHPIGVVYLCRDAEGLVPVRRFVESYRSNPAGRPHNLYVLFKGFKDPDGLRIAHETFGDLPIEPIELPDTGFDIGSYAAAARQVDNEKLVFLNTFSRILAPNWLALLDTTLESSDVGVAGATGSWQSHLTIRYPSALLRSAGHFARLVRTSIDYPAFPNPHLRTNAFIVRRKTMLDMLIPEFSTKEDVFKFESGRHSFTRQIARRAGRAVVVDRHGSMHESGRWNESHTFWSADQAGLLIADNQTDDFAFGTASRRSYLERFAWTQTARPNAAENFESSRPNLKAVRGVASRGSDAFEMTETLSEIAIEAGSIPRYTLMTVDVAASTLLPISACLRISTSGPSQRVEVGPISQPRRIRLIIKRPESYDGLSLILSGDVGAKVTLSNLTLETWTRRAQVRMLRAEAADLWKEFIHNRQQLFYATLRLSLRRAKHFARANRAIRQTFIKQINSGPTAHYSAWLAAVDPIQSDPSLGTHTIAVFAVVAKSVPDLRWWKRLPDHAVVLVADGIDVPTDGDDRSHHIVRYGDVSQLAAAARRALAKLAHTHVAVLPARECLHPAFASMTSAFVAANGPFDAVYCDDDELAPDGSRKNPLFKPDWSPILHTSRPYVTGTVVYRRERLLGLADESLARLLLDPAAGILISAENGRIGHLPAVLVHRMEDSLLPVSQPTPLIPPRGRVSIVIPTAGRHMMLRGRKVDLAANIVENLRACSTWPDIEIIVVPSRGLSAETYDALHRHSVVVLPEVAGRNLSDKMNQGAAVATGDLVVFMNDDIEVIAPDWLERMAAQALRPEVGVVGALLLYENETVQHGGVVFRELDVRHLYAGSEIIDEGYLGWLAHPHERAAVTGACIMLRRDVFRTIGGFDDRFAFLYNDIDLCLRARSHGLSVVIEPRAKLFHFERSSLGFEPTDARDADWFFARWDGATAYDSYYPRAFVGVSPSFQES